MLNDLDSQHPNAAFYRFTNVFYFETPKSKNKSKMSDSKNSINAEGGGEIPEFILGLTHTKHISPTPSGMRTKCIYKPHRMSQVYTHFGVPLNINYTEIVIPVNYTCVQHYRNSAPPGGFHATELFDDDTIHQRYEKKIKSTQLYDKLRQLLVPHNSTIA